MWNDFLAELLKLRAQRKNFVVFAGFALVTVLIMLSLYYSGMSRWQTSVIRQAGSSIEDVLDGLYFARIVLLPMALMILPIFICTVAGDMVAGELQEGCLKLYAARPRSRGRIIITRILAMTAFTFMVCLTLTVAALLIGVLVYGLPGLQLVLLDPNLTDSEFSFMSAPQAIKRLGVEMIYRVFSLLALGCMTLFFSCIFRRMTTATVVGVTVYFACYFVQMMPDAASIRPYLLTTVMNSANYLWLDMIPWQRLFFSFLHLLGYIVFFGGMSLVAFTYRDLA